MRSDVFLKWFLARHTNAVCIRDELGIFLIARILVALTRLEQKCYIISVRFILQLYQSTE